MKIAIKIHLPRVLGLEIEEYVVDAANCDSTICDVIKRALRENATPVVECIKAKECIVAINGKVVEEAYKPLSSLISTCGSELITVEVVPLAHGG